MCNVQFCSLVLESFRQRMFQNFFCLLLKKLRLAQALPGCFSLLLSAHLSLTYTVPVHEVTHTLPLSFDGYSNLKLTLPLSVDMNLNKGRKSRKIKKIQTVNNQ